MFLINPYILQSAAASTDFKMTVDTTQAGSASDTFILPCGNHGTYNAVIDWGDGTTSDITTYNDADLTHVYSTGGTYQISISGDLGWILFDNAGDKLKVSSIDNWGDIAWRALDKSFYGCSNMVINATDTPVLSNLTYISGGRLYRTFRDCTSLTTISNFNQWDTSTIKNLTGAFMNCTNLSTLDMSNLDLSSIQSFGANAADAMFLNCTNLTSVDVSNVTINNVSSVNASYMFYNCGTFDLAGLDTWDISQINNFTGFLQNSKITTAEYDSLLISWAGQDAVDSLSVNFGTSQYTLGGAAASARADLISTDLWTITDGGGI